MSDREVRVEVDEDAAWIAAALVLAASLSGAVVLAEWPLLGVGPAEPEEPRLVEPTDGGTQLWPYTARTPAHDGRTLGINVVFFGDPAAVRTALTERSELTWEDEQVHEGDADSDTVSPERIELDPEVDSVGEFLRLEAATGSDRYTYVVVGGEGRWVAESYQLHAGTYLGSRLHIRAYDDPQGEWTAVQVHQEHWDWFRLRHTVTGISDAQREIERDFMGEPYVGEVVRLPFENETADSDGWVTGIRLALLSLSLALFGFVWRPRRMWLEIDGFLRRRRRALTLGGGLFALYTGIRYAGIAGELLLAGVSPPLVAAPLYVTLVLGTPAVAYRLGRGSDVPWAFTLAVVGLGCAFLLDYLAMDVSVLSLRVVLHRVAVLLAVGLVATGGSLAADVEGNPSPLLIGLAGWALALFAPLFGYV